jgi:hypothetical protein
LRIEVHQTLPSNRLTLMETLLFRLATGLLLLAGAAGANPYATSISFHPYSFLYGNARDHGSWLTLTQEQHVAPRLSLILRPARYALEYTENDVGLFGPGYDVHGSVEAIGLYLGPRLYFGDGPGQPFFQVSAKQGWEEVVETLDVPGHHRWKTAGALFYTGFRWRAGLIQAEWNAGLGRNFLHYDRDVSGNTDGYFPGDLLFDMNFAIGFHT